MVEKKYIYIYFFVNFVNVFLSSAFRFYPYKTHIKPNMTHWNSNRNDRL